MSSNEIERESWLNAVPEEIIKRLTKLLSLFISCVSSFFFPVSVTSFHAPFDVSSGGKELSFLPSFILIPYSCHCLLSLQVMSGSWCFFYMFFVSKVVTFEIKKNVTLLSWGECLLHSLSSTEEISSEIQPEDGLLKKEV